MTGNYKGRVKPNPARDARMGELYKAGVKAADIAVQFNLTRTGVTDALRKAGITRTPLEKQVASAVRVGGLRADFDSDDQMVLALQRFREQRRRALQRGIGWELTFAQWWSIWRVSGQWQWRGRSAANSAVMSRHGDTGPYSATNVRITTLVGNFVESHVVRGHRVRSELLETTVSFLTPF